MCACIGSVWRKRSVAWAVLCVPQFGSPSFRRRHAIPYQIFFRSMSSYFKLSSLFKINRLKTAFLICIPVSAMLKSNIQQRTPKVMSDNTTKKKKNSLTKYFWKLKGNYLLHIEKDLYYRYTLCFCFWFQGPLWFRMWTVALIFFNINRYK